MGIISNTVSIKLCPSNINYWRGKGYAVKAVGGYGGKNGNPVIDVNVDDLQPKSNVCVNCECDICGTEYKQRYYRNTDVCYSCRKSAISHNQSKQMIGNKFYKNVKNRNVLSGVDHPRWNPNKTEFQRFSNKVRSETEKTYKRCKQQLNPDEYNRTLCGVTGGYQLDHIVSIKDGFDNNIPINELSHVNNLQLIPWKENRTKWY